MFDDKQECACKGSKTAGGETCPDETWKGIHGKTWMAV